MDKFNKLYNSIIAEAEVKTDYLGRKFCFNGTGSEIDELKLWIPRGEWKAFGKSPYWTEIVSLLNEDCLGNFYGIDHSQFKVIRKDGKDYESGVLTFNGVNDEEHKSPEMKIKNNLEAIGFEDSVF